MIWDWAKSVVSQCFKRPSRSLPHFIRLWHKTPAHIGQQLRLELRQCQKWLCWFLSCLRLSLASGQTPLLERWRHVPSQLPSILKAYIYAGYQSPRKWEGSERSGQAEGHLAAASVTAAVCSGPLDSPGENRIHVPHTYSDGYLWTGLFIRGTYSYPFCDRSAHQAKAGGVSHFFSYSHVSNDVTLLNVTIQG